MAGSNKANDKKMIAADLDCFVMRSSPLRKFSKKVSVKYKHKIPHKIEIMPIQLPANKVVIIFTMLSMSVERVQEIICNG